MELSESGLIKQLDKIKFSYDKNNPTRGGSFIELPKWVQTMKACINIENQDDMCFKYSVYTRSRFVAIFASAESWLDGKAESVLCRLC